MEQSEEAKRLERETDSESFAIDNAFLKACRRCGIEPEELKSRPLESFEKKGVPHDVAVRKFNNFQELRVRKLNMIVTERKKVLQEDDAVLVPHPPRREEMDSSSTTSSQLGGQRDLLLDRAHRIRSHWSTMHKRQRRAKQYKDDMEAERHNKALEFAARHRAVREEEEEKRLLLHKANMHQLQQRWIRDEELAKARQANIDAEYEARIKSHTEHMKVLDTANVRQQEMLEKKAFSRGKEESTQNRLQKANTLKTEKDAKFAETAHKAIDKVEARRKEHVVQKFLTQVEFTNRSIEERKHIEKVLDKAAEIEKDRIRHIKRSAAQREKLSHATLNGNQNVKQESMKQRSLKRDESIKQAHEHRVKEEKVASAKRQQTEAERQRKEEERAKRKHLDDLLKAEDAKARTEHRNDILNRVAKCAAYVQEERIEKQRRRQQAAEERRLLWRQQITSILNADSDEEDSEEDQGDSGSNPTESNSPQPSSTKQEEDGKPEPEQPTVEAGDP